MSLAQCWVGLRLFYKPLFQKAYNQFPLLHINGLPVMVTSDFSTLARMFYYNQEPKTKPILDRVCARSLTGTDSILMIGEYKFVEMAQGVHDRPADVSEMPTMSIFMGRGHRDND